MVLRGLPVASIVPYPQLFIAMFLNVLQEYKMNFFLGFFRESRPKSMFKQLITKL